MVSKKAKQGFKKDISRITGLFSEGSNQRVDYKVLSLLVNKALKNNFPIYSLLVVLLVKKESSEPVKLKIDGWHKYLPKDKVASSFNDNAVNTSSLEKAIFWKRAFIWSSCVSSIIIFLLLFNLWKSSTISSNKSGKPLTNLNHTYKKINEHPKKINQSNSTKNEIIQADSVYVFDKNRNSGLKKDAILDLEKLKIKLHEKDNKIARLNNYITKIKKQLEEEKQQSGLLSKQLKSYKFDNEVITRKVHILEEKINRINDVKFEIGKKYNPAEKCNGKYLEDEKLLFSTKHDVLIRSALVMAKKNGILNIVLRDNTKKLMYHKQIHLIKGRNIINLNFSVSKGNKHYLVFYGVKLLSLKTCYHFPYTVPNLITLTGSDNIYYPGFFNLIVSAKL